MLALAAALPSVWQPAKSAMQSLIARLHQPTNQLRTGGSTRLTTLASGPGHETMLAIQAPHISDTVIARATTSSAAALSEARKHLVAQNADAALAALSSADQTDPSILFGKAVTTLHRGGNGRAIEAQRLLRGATQKAVAPALMLNALVLYQLLA